MYNRDVFAYIIKNRFVTIFNESLIYCSFQFSLTHYNIIGRGCEIHL